MIRLWHISQSRSFRVLWAPEELGLDYDLIRCSFFDKSLRAPDHLARAPAGRVPALEMDGLAMCESGAILLHWAETRGPHLRVAEGERGRAAFLQRVHYAETLGAHLANLTQYHIVLREDWVRLQVVMRLEALRLAAALRGVGPGWTTGQFTVADIALGYAVWIAQRFVELPPHAARYLDACQARAAFQRAEALDGPAVIYKHAFYPPPEEQRP